MNKPFYIHIVTILLLIEFLILFSGCAMFQSPIQKLPDRKTFSGSFIKQGSFTELKESYCKHYEQVARELHCLEDFYHKSLEKPEWLAEKIEYHKKYLSDMASYPFLCPSHNTIFIENREKQCPSCNGEGKTFWGKVCSTCLGKGKIYYQVKENRKCPYCKQFYKSNILGKSLYENR